ncbi:melanoma-derived growth regulatory protein-like precursor [Callorhinchus milii]|uniref:Melanoma-derived growth regulatory protein n=2 Tax=Callorhinchus milii TaxID=7868 RepID=K4FSK4_CALMI|nr:melanoma-derived growth regulatory protein-like precursor [Callorhinchus milii]AFK10660.1 melanoma-derived growth regulatory protein [Callorhinchus milii]|eukprot:gi/632989197/ref/XP_007883519.1/ PREDICTED: melanoma-derived growth regulatory protein-like [Callorhinchus milii]
MLRMAAAGAVLALCAILSCVGVLAQRGSVMHKLADRKICADEECSYPMAMVRAVGDYSGSDCRFINVRQGQIVYVYAKLKGRGRNFWQGTAQGSYYGGETGKLGFFPKVIVRELQRLATETVEMPTDDWDFYCQ